MNRGLLGLFRGTSTDKGGDAADLASFGYQQELERSLGSFSSFAAGFSYISILTGMFQLFYWGFGVGGPAFFWTWPLVLVGQVLVALCFAELASRYPLSGGVYQWAKYVASPGLAWMTGWIYLACLVVTLAAVAMALQNTLPQIHPFFQFIGDGSQAIDSAKNAILLGILLISVSVVINSVGVHLLSSINNVGVICELVGVIALIVLLALHSVRDTAQAVLDTGGKAGPGFFGYFSPFLAATGLTASYVMFGFDTAGSLAEETTSPRVRAPRAILQALLAAGIAGLLLLFFALKAAPDLSAPQLSSSAGGLGFIVTSVLGEKLGKFLLLAVVFAISVCVLAVHSGAVRIIFAMARDGQLPFSGWLRKVSPETHLPIVPVVLSGLFASGFLLFNIRSPKVVELVTSVAVVWANLAYFLVVSALLWRRLKDKSWKKDGHFSLGKFGLPVNILAVLWSGFLFINVGWPREQLFGTDPVYRFSALWLTLLLVGVGSLHYLFFHRRKEAICVGIPEGLPQ